MVHFHGKSNMETACKSIIRTLVGIWFVDQDFCQRVITFITLAVYTFTFEEREEMTGFLKISMKNSEATT